MLQITDEKLCLPIVEPQVEQNFCSGDDIESTGSFLKFAGAEHGCGRSPREAPSNPEEYLNQFGNHSLNQPHATRTISLKRHICPCCNRAAPDMYRCKTCQCYFLNVTIDMHEENCNSGPHSYNLGSK